eukprot:GGOE01001133.1.p1 GENE.GGOE01001133.1~~GGOE01001133.1.p1  ORF type:complete len:202 (-),score=63.06 GGOE01001133.1:232-837(-)
MCNTASLTAFHSQPDMCRGVLQRLAECLEPTPRQEALAELAEYSAVYTTAYQRQMLLKLGLSCPGQDASVSEKREALLSDLQDVMRSCSADYTTTFQLLQQVPRGAPLEQLAKGLATSTIRVGDVQPILVEAWTQWLRRYRLEVEREPSAEECLACMARVNPTYVLREAAVCAALADAERGSFSAVERLLEEVQRPYAAFP